MTDPASAHRTPQNGRRSTLHAFPREPQVIAIDAATR